MLVGALATAELPLGGTGLNAATGFAERVIQLISEQTGVPFREAQNHFEAQTTQDAVAS